MRTSNVVVSKWLHQTFSIICFIVLSVLPFINASGLDFFFWGDWGRNFPASKSESGVNYEEAKVANQINAFATSIKPSFMCALGDNFYDIGVSSTTDPLWQEYYTSLYTAPATFVPWYPIMGNHDYGGQNPQPEIDYYLERKDSRWTFPDYQYTKVWSIPGSTRTLQIIFINTITLCPEARAKQIGWPPNPTNAIPNPDATSAAQNRYVWQPTLQWIQSTLSHSTADWVLVAGHYHFFTNSEGEQNTTEAACLQQRLLPLLQHHNVAAYMNGHEHNFQHYHLDGIHFLTVGHGCDRATALLPGTPTGLLFNLTIGGFATMHVTGNDLNLKYIDENGKTIHAYTIPHKRRRKAAV